MIESEDRTYTQLIESLADSHLTTAVFLKEAELNRIERLSHWQSGVRLRGYEDLVPDLLKVDKYIVGTESFVV